MKINNMLHREFKIVTINILAKLDKRVEDL